MDNKEYEVAKEAANKNYVSLNRQMPRIIQRKEESIYQKLSNSKQGRLKKLETLFAEMDEIYDFVQKFTICKKGCNHCCHYEIAISDLEIEYVKSKIKINKIKRNSDPNSCPFLKNGACLIYQYRPFLCRRHLSIADSPKWCKSDVCHNYEFPLVAFTEVNKCYAYLLGPHDADSLKDIRQAFNIRKT